MVCQTLLTASGHVGERRASRQLYWPPVLSESVSIAGNPIVPPERRSGRGSPEPAALWSTTVTWLCSYLPRLLVSSVQTCQWSSLAVSGKQKALQGQWIVKKKVPCRR